MLCLPFYTSYTTCVVLYNSDKELYNMLYISTRLFVICRPDANDSALSYDWFHRVPENLGIEECALPSSVLIDSYPGRVTHGTQRC